MTGPSTNTAGRTIPWYAHIAPRPATIQRRLRTSRHPARIASRNGGGVSSDAAAATRGRSRSRHATLTANDAASNSSAAPAPIPPRARPRAPARRCSETEKLMPRSAFAGWS